MPWVATGAGRATAITAAIALVTLVNTAGVRQAAWTVNAFTVAKLAPLLAMVVIGAVSIDSDVLASQHVAEPQWTEAILLLVFAFGGFESAVVAGGESRDPARDTGFALLVGMTIVTLLYCLVQLVVVGVLPQASGHTAPVSAALGRADRSGRNHARQHRRPRLDLWLAHRFCADVTAHPLRDGRARRVPPGAGTAPPTDPRPAAAIVVNAAIAWGLGLIGDFGQLATFAAISRLGIYATTCAALIVLRRTRGPSTAFRAPGGPVLPVLGIAFCGWLLTTRSLEEAWFLPVIVFAGLAIWRSRRRPPA